MIKLAKTSTTEIVEVFQITGEKVILSEDEKEIQINFPPLAKAVSSSLTTLNINNTYSYTDKIGCVRLHDSVAPLEVIEYKFETKCGLVLIVKITHSVQKEHEEEHYEE